MSLMCAEDEPATSINRYYAEYVATGEKDSDIVNVPPHWHKVSKLPLPRGTWDHHHILLEKQKHGEYHIVLDGRLEVTVDGKVIILKAGDAALYVPPKAVHSIRSFPGERMVAQERAEPPGTYKLE